MLTVNQALAIKTGTLKPPWRASQLVSPASVSPISLRSLVNAIGNQRTLIFLQVRDLSILKNYKTANELSNAWAGLIPNDVTFQASLEVISRALPVGASIVYVSTDGQTVAISGTINALSSVVGVVLTKDQIDQRTKGLEDIAQGLGIAAGAEGALAAAMVAGAAGVPELVILMFLGVAFIAAGLMLGVGIGALASFCASVSTTFSGEQVQDLPVVGVAPDFGKNFSNDEAINDLLLQLMYSEMTDIPDPGTLPGAADLIPEGPDEPGGGEAAA